MKYLKGAVGAKFFDYLALRKPILAFGIKNGIIDNILTETGSGKLFEMNDVDGAAKFITKYLNIWRKNHFIILEKNKKLMNYSTKKNVKTLTEIFNSI